MASVRNPTTPTPRAASARGARKTSPLISDAPRRAAARTHAPAATRVRRSESRDGVLSTKELIVRAAAEAFAARGYCGVNLTDVVESLGYTKGALYFYFPTKEAVATEIVTRHFNAWEDMVTPALAESETNLDALVAVSRRVAEMYRTDPIARAGSRLSTERNLIAADLPEPFVGWIDKVTALLRAAKRAKEIRADIEPRALARTIVSYFYGAQLVSEHFSGRQDLPSQVNQFWALLLPTIRAS
jgi:AcrR family transcriptional regulator